MADLCVEACAKFLDEYYRRNYGHVLHYNVDKALFLAGDAEIHYGGGKILKPPCFILGGQVSELNPILELGLRTTIRQAIHEQLPNLGYVKIEIRCNNVSKNLMDIASNEQILCNDTSFGVGHYPFSESEQLVCNIRDTIETIRKNGLLPIGELYKIMLTPRGTYISIPLYAQHIHSRESYAICRNKLEGILKVFGRVVVNPDFDSGFPYLTLTGSSIECGDDGQVGRGNRYNGLITPCRPMTIEAYHGKNNRNHIGKLYSRQATLKAKEIWIKTGNLAEVILVGSIGRPVNDPEVYVRLNRRGEWKRTR